MSRKDLTVVIISYLMLALIASLVCDKNNSSAIDCDQLEIIECGN